MLPLAGGDNTITVSGSRLPSGSLSFARMSIVTGALEGVAALSLRATGSLLARLTMTVTAAMFEATPTVLRTV